MSFGLLNLMNSNLLANYASGWGGGGGAWMENLPGMLQGWESAQPWWGSVGETMGGGQTAGYPFMGVGDWVTAGIAAQHAMSNSTDTRFEGVRTDDAFGGHFGTEPWLAFAHDKLGLDPTRGEMFDAAVENNNWGDMKQRLPGMLSYWGDPSSTWIESGATKAFGKDVGKWANPTGMIMDKIGGWL